MANFKGYFSLKAADFGYRSQILLLLYTLQYSLGAGWDCKCATRTLKSNVLQLCHRKGNFNSFVDNSENMLLLKLGINPPAICTLWATLPLQESHSFLWEYLRMLTLIPGWGAEPDFEIQTSLLDHAVDRCVLLKGSKHPAQDVPFNLPSAFLSCSSLMFQGVLCSLCEVLPPVRSNQTCNRLSSFLKPPKGINFLKDMVFTCWFGLFSIIHYLPTNVFFVDLSCLFLVRELYVIWRQWFSHQGLDIQIWGFATLLFSFQWRIPLLNPSKQANEEKPAFFIGKIFLICDVY